MDAIQSIQTWFLSQCNGDWEHQNGISIVSTDNPGWWVKIDVKQTQLQERSFAEISRNIGSDGHPSDTNWIRCYMESGIWNGAGDAKKLSEILEAFCKWAL